MVEEVKPKSMIEEAREVVAAQKAENDRREKLLKQEQDLQSQRILGGSTSGAPQETTPKPTTNKEEMAKWKELMKKGSK